MRRPRMEASRELGILFAKESRSRPHPTRNGGEIKTEENGRKPEQL